MNFCWQKFSKISIRESFLRKVFDLERKSSFLKHFTATGLAGQVIEWDKNAQKVENWYLAPPEDSSCGGDALADLRDVTKASLVGSGNKKPVGERQFGEINTSDRPGGWPKCSTSKTSHNSRRNISPLYFTSPSRAAIFFFSRSLRRDVLPPLTRHFSPYLCFLDLPDGKSAFSEESNFFSDISYL